MNHREKVFTFGGTSCLWAKFCLGEMNPPRQPSPPEPTEQTFGSHREKPSTALQNFPTGMWSSVASASFHATRRTLTHGHQRRIPTRACIFFAPLRTRVRTSSDWCRRNPLLTIDTSVSAFTSDRYPMPIHNPIDREASWRGELHRHEKSRLKEHPLVVTLSNTFYAYWTEQKILIQTANLLLTTATTPLYTKKRPDARAGSNVLQHRRAS